MGEALSKPLGKPPQAQAQPQTQLRTVSRTNVAPHKNYLFEFLYLGISLAGCAMLMKWSLEKLDPTRGSKKAAAKKKAMLHKRLGRAVETNAHEDAIALDAVNPDDLEVSLADIGGLEDAKQALVNKVIMPLKLPALFNSYLLRQAKGVLLYGPPGTGKTMLAKALAKEAGANFINIRSSTLQSKWFGETQKLTFAVFSLAYKLQPCIVFIDEAESVLGRRRESEHEAVSAMKTEFMQLWDGFSTDASASVMVLAATNRPFDLDDAVLRRFSLQLEVGMPGPEQREAILRLILRKAAREGARAPGAMEVSPALVQNEPTGANGTRPLAAIAQRTDGFSGSDLMELCSRAAAASLQDQMASAGEAGASGRVELTLDDFEKVLRDFRPSTRLAEAYRTQHAATDRHAAAVAAEQGAAADLFLRLLAGGVQAATPAGAAGA